MYKYEVKIPLILEQKSNFNRYDLSSSQQLNFEYSGKYDKTKYLLKGSNANYEIIFTELISKNYEECMEDIEKYLKIILPLSSLIIQSQHSSQNYTHLRLGYDISNSKLISEKSISRKEEHVILKNIEITDSLRMRESLNMLMRQNIDFKLLDELLLFMNQDKEFSFILECYYRAIASTDSITKFYNAFTAIEFIESNFTKKISTNLLIDNDTLEQLEKNIQNNNLINEDNEGRIINRIKSTLKSATLESRAEKLEQIIIDFFKVKEIIVITESRKINLKFISSLIKIRNSLFHGKHFKEEEKNEIFKIGLELIKLLENILINWKNINH